MSNYLATNQTSDRTQTSRILVVDDEPGIRDGLKLSLEQMGYEVNTAANGEEALQKFKQHPDVSFVLSDFKMPGMSGFDVLREIKKQSPRTKVVLMTGFGSINHAVTAMQHGADDYLAKPFSIDALERIILKNAPKEVLSISSDTIISSDNHFQAILRKAERAAKGNVPILVEGASGTGKELLARQIHEWSPRAGKAWVAINCAALPAGLLESELFGFEKGAFTGAMERKPGKFEQATGGTLLLDEIGDLDLILQAKLLRVLQEGEVDRLGGRKSVKVDVRIIATTNRNLERLVHEGKFREDLFFRLYGVRFVLPSLKDRPLDIAILAQNFVARQAKEQGRDLELSDEVIPHLQRMNWPGNIRQLERAVERAAVLSETGLIKIEHFEFQNLVPTTAVYKSEVHNRIQIDQKPIREMEREIILQALDAHSGNRTHTAKSLGMSLRTLRHKLKQYREQGLLNESGETGQDLLGRNFPLERMDATLDASFAASTVGEDLASHNRGVEWNR